MNPIEAIRDARGHLALSFVFILGLAGGVWTAIAPFVTSWPLGANGAWTHAVWSAVLVGAVLTLISGAGLVVSAGFAVRAATQARAAAAAAEEIA